MQIPMLKGDKVGSNTDYRDGLLTNMYAVKRDILGAKGYVLSFYGLSEFASGSGIDRGGKWVSRDGLEGHYRVSGTDFIRIDAGGAVTVLGTIPGSAQASIDFSFNNVAVVADGKLFYYNPTDGFRQMADPDIGAPIDIVWVDGYFFLTDGETIYHSNILNEEQFDQLAFSNAEFMPDSSRGLGLTEENEVLVFGEFSKQSFINVGSTPFAFQTIPRKSQKIGILGVHCKKELNGKWYTLSRREDTAPSFHIISIGAEQSISTRETDVILQSYTDDELASSTIDAFVDGNVVFIAFHLPAHTLVFNESVAESFGLESAWSVLKTDTVGDLTYRGRNVVRDPRNGKWLIGDRRDGKIGEIDRTICTHYGDMVEWLIHTPAVNLETGSINKLEIETIPGNSPDNDARVFISMSQDMRTNSMEYSKEYGMNNQFGLRFIARRLGYVRSWVTFRLRGVSRSRMAFSNFDIEVS